MNYLLNWWWQLGFIPAILAGLCVLIGVLSAAKVFWHKTNEEHYDTIAAFDGLIWSLVAGLLAARFSFLLLRWSTVPFSLEAMLNFWAYPGLWPPAGLVAAYFVLAQVAHKQKRDIFETWDFYTLALVCFMFWYWLSRFLVGAGAGMETALPWGIVFPQRVAPAHPVPLYGAVVLFLLWRYLWWVEPRFRFFLWYRSKKRTANPGYIFAMFLIVSGLLGIGLGFIRYPFVMFLDLDLNQVIDVIMFLSGLVILYLRSGRSIFVKKEKGTYVSSDSSAT